MEDLEFIHGELEGAGTEIGWIVLTDVDKSVRCDLAQVGVEGSNPFAGYFLDISSS
jgi:hypothetical protein